MAKGFFTDPRLTGSKTNNKQHPCEKCKLYTKGAITPRMPVTGEGKQRIWVHGEGPGAEEDKHGKQFHEKGAAGQLLRQKLRIYNINLDRDCWKDNSVRCRPPKNRTPTDTEIKLCQNWVLPDLKYHMPNKIFLFGGPAIKSLITTRLKGVKFDGVKKWVGWQIPDQELKAWIFPIWHTSFLNRNRDDKALWLRFDQFLEAMADHDLSIPHYKQHTELVTIIENVDDATSLLTKLIQEKKPGAIDWETTGLKPHREGHRIVTGAIATSQLKAYAFPIFDNKRFLARLKRWLRDPDIKKYTHNQGMEQSWAINILGEEIKSIVWDSMEVSHVIDNRPDITSLKFQVYINYGITYGYEMQKYLRPTETEKKKHGANAFNRIDKAPMDKLLLYNGADALYTYWLCCTQMLREDGWSSKVATAAIEGAATLSKVHQAGIPIDVEYCKEQDKRLGRRLEKVKADLDESNEVKTWREHTGKELNYDADPQLNKLLHRILDYKPKKETAKGNPSVDKEVLQEIGSKFTLNIIRFRQINKLKNTYLNGFYRESIDGIMRPFFPTHLVTTYRGSSSDPNFTNIPKRDKQAKRITRRAIVPRKSRQILDVDYKGIEVCMGACNSHDPKLIEYVSNPKTDMHRDQAMEIYLLREHQVSKGLRQGGKNAFVFPEFYGSYWGNCAPDLWQYAKENTLTDGTPTIEHLRDQGIKSYKKFEKHIEDVEDQFWNVKFAVYRDWKDSMWDFYTRHGYIELLTGHRCYWSPRGLLSRKECMNYPNQGPAFRCLLRSMVWLDNLINEERGWSSRMIGQIHDDIVWDLEPSELKHLWPVLQQVMCRDIREHWPWIIVPLEIEGEVTEVDGNWNEQKVVNF